MKKFLIVALIIIIAVCALPKTSAANIAEGEGWYITEEGCLHLTGSIFRGSSGPVWSNTYYVPWNAYKENIISVIAEEGSSIDNCNCLFSELQKLKSVYLSRLDTSDVTDTSYMFFMCTDLEILDINGIDTSNVTNMSYMFRGCTGLISLDISDFNTSQVTNMNSMFNGCSGLTSLDISSFDTSLVYYMESMFYDCSSLSFLDVSGFNTSHATSMNNMFYGCSGLTSLDVSGFITSGVMGMNNMFAFCSSLTSLDVSGFKTSQVTGMSSMFASCSGLTSLDVSSFDTHFVTGMSSMFASCSSLTSLDISSFKTANVKYMNNMFASCSGLTSLNVSRIDTTQVTDMSMMFYGCKGLTTLDLSHFKTTNVTDMESMFEGCYSLRSLNIPYFSVSKIDKEHIKNILYDCNSLNTITISPDILNLCAEQLFLIQPSWMNVYTHKIFNSPVIMGSIEYAATFIIPTDNIEILNGWCLDAEGCLHIFGNVMYKNSIPPWNDFKEQISSVIAEKGSSINNCRELFFQCKNLVSADLSMLNTSVVKDMYRMFSECSSLSELDITSLNTSAVINMSYMFDNCNSLTALNVADFNTSKVNSMSHMFSDCGNLLFLDVSGFDTSAVTDMSYMFNNCKLLKALDTSGFDTSKARNMKSMFSGCNNVVSLNVSDFNTSNVTDMSMMFQDCENLTSLDLLSFVTSNVKDMSFMFDTCLSLTSLDLSSFNITSTEKMNKMFSCCSSLEYLDISSFNQVYGYIGKHETIFSSCNALKTIKISPYMLNLYANDLLIFQPTWKNADTNEIYYSASELRKIKTKVTLYNPNIATGDSWYIDENGCLYITGMIHNPSSPIHNQGMILSMAQDKTPWIDYKDFIKAVVAQEGATIDSGIDLFMNCTNLESADLSNLDTSDVIDMRYMFYNCKLLTSLNVSNFNTSNVWNMSDMFYGCESLTVLDVTEFDTSNVTYMPSMFYGCKMLTLLDISNFNTSNVTNMYSMFQNMNSITSLDLSNFDTSNVSSMYGMFISCKSLESLDISNFSTVKVSNYYQDTYYLWDMFTNCIALKTVKISPDMLNQHGNELLTIAPIWYDEETGDEYFDVEELKAIATPVTLIGKHANNSASLSLDGNIGVNFYLDLDAYPRAERVEITCADPDSESGKAVTYVFDSFDGFKSGDSYKFTASVAAAQMTEPVTVAIYDAQNAVLYRKTVTVRSLLETYIEYYSSYPAVADLCKTMLTYGSNAQQYFNYRTADLADVNYGADISSVPASAADGFNTLWIDSDPSDGFECLTQSFSCRSNTVMNYVFSVDDGLSAADFTAEFISGGEGLSIEVTDRGADIAVSISGIPAALIDNYFTFSVKCGEKNVGIVSGCGMCYVRLVLNTPAAGEKFQNLARSIYAYNKAANYYFGK